MRRKPNGCLALPPSSVFRMKRVSLEGLDFVMVESSVSERVVVTWMRLVGSIGLVRSIGLVGGIGPSGDSLVGIKWDCWWCAEVMIT